MIYQVNVDPIPPKLGLRVIQFVSKLGHYKLPEGADDFECTTAMIDALAENIISNIGTMSTFDKIDFAIGSMVIPIPPVRVENFVLQFCIFRLLTTISVLRKFEMLPKISAAYENIF